MYSKSLLVNILVVGVGIGAGGVLIYVVQRLTTRRVLCRSSKCSKNTNTQQHQSQQSHQQSQHVQHVPLGHLSAVSSQSSVRRQICPRLRFYDFPACSSIRRTCLRFALRRATRCVGIYTYMGPSTSFVEKVFGWWHTCWVRDAWKTLLCSLNRGGGTAYIEVGKKTTQRDSDRDRSARNELAKGQSQRTQPEGETRTTTQHVRAQPHPTSRHRIEPTTTRAASHQRSNAPSVSVQSKHSTTHHEGEEEAHNNEGKTQSQNREAKSKRNPNENTQNPDGGFVSTNPYDVLVDESKRRRRGRGKAHNPHNTDAHHVQPNQAGVQRINDTRPPVEGNHKTKTAHVRSDIPNPAGAASNGNRVASVQPPQGGIVPASRVVAPNNPINEHAHKSPTSPISTPSQLCAHPVDLNFAINQNTKNQSKSRTQIESATHEKPQSGSLRDTPSNAITQSHAHSPSNPRPYLHALQKRSRNTHTPSAPSTTQSPPSTAVTTQCPQRSTPPSLPLSVSPTLTAESATANEEADDDDDAQHGAQFSLCNSNAVAAPPSLPQSLAPARPAPCGVVRPSGENAAAASPTTSPASLWSWNFQSPLPSDVSSSVDAFADHFDKIINKNVSIKGHNSNHTALQPTILSAAQEVLHAGVLQMAAPISAPGGASLTTPLTSTGLVGGTGVLYDIGDGGGNAMDAPCPTFFTSPGLSLSAASVLSPHQPCANIRESSSPASPRQGLGQHYDEPYKPQPNQCNQTTTHNPADTQTKSNFCRAVGPPVRRGHSVGSPCGYGCGCGHVQRQQSS